MTDVHDTAKVRDRLWDEVRKARYGMLGLVGGDTHQHFQPMTAFCDQAAEQIWFFCRNDTDLAKAVGRGPGAAMFTVMAKDQEFQACIGGELHLDHDRARMEELWNPVISAWYPEGRDDPRLTMIRFDLKDAAVWLNVAGPVRFAFEIARANITGKTPDVGDHTHVNLS